MLAATEPRPDRTFRSSDLSRLAPKVFAAAEDHPVEITRRDGEDLVLMSKREADARDQLLQFAAQLIAVATDDRGSLAERMSNSFPWMLALSADDRVQCAKDLVDAARASFATGQPHLAIAELTAWKETATALAAGLGRSPVEWLEDGEPAERP
ncbi:YebG family protein [Agromyces bauzanensis]|uniref:Prevent-host-death protein n=1 Tax=Agromyces bauzanensis TaxID=1308924 RepID=A0A917PUP8_9MICO|nr:YebG family protein [Agromyces bauzanensis]GGJ93408.1 prevent-host-death protein [Agromyces bauzanensis]